MCRLYTPCLQVSLYSLGAHPLILYNLLISFGGKDKYNLCKHLGEADFCGQVLHDKYFNVIEGLFLIITTGETLLYRPLLESLSQMLNSIVFLLKLSLDLMFKISFLK